MLTRGNGSVRDTFFTRDVLLAGDLGPDDRNVLSFRVTDIDAVGFRFFSFFEASKNIPWIFFGFSATNNS